MFVRSADEFSKLMDHLRQTGSFAIDTEFVREETYRPQLCLVQLGTHDDVWLVDPFEISDMTPLVELLADASVEKIVHAGQQDFEIFFAGTEEVPRKIFDTQVAAALLGRGTQISYGRLVEAALGVTIKKGEQYTDWSRRPLRKAQVEYAKGDVLHLPRLRDCLFADLSERGRGAWLEDELRFYQDPTTYVRPPRELYRRVKGAARLQPRELGILRELAEWRETEATQRDRPRNRIVRDDCLLELARRAPKNHDAISQVRGIHPRLLKRSAKDILRCVEQGKSLPASELPASLEKDPLDERVELAVNLLDTVLQALSAETEVAATYIGTKRDLTELAKRCLCGDREVQEGDDLRLLQGWRYELAGRNLVAVLGGNAVVRIDDGHVRIVPD